MFKAEVVSPVLASLFMTSCSSSESKLTLEERIGQAWDENSKGIEPPDLSCISEAMEKLNSGELRVAQKDSAGGNWIVNEYLKKAILLYLKHTKSKLIKGSYCNYFDKVPLKMCGWTEEDFCKDGFRSVPGGVARYAAYIAKSVIVMPSFINVGAYVDEGSMIDTSVLVGSCAQIGKKCHISDGVTIGGVLEPLQANPVIVEDDCFIGVKCALTEGVIVGQGAVLGAGTIITGSTRIINRDTGEITYGKIPPYSVVVPGSYSSGSVNLNCAVIIKQVDEKTRAKTSINELLR